MRQENLDLGTIVSSSSLPVEAIGAKIYINDVQIGFVINKTYERLLELKRKVETGEVNEGD